MTMTLRAPSDPDPLSRKSDPDPLSRKSDPGPLSRKSEPGPLSGQPESSELQASSLPPALIAALQTCTREQLQLVPAAIAQILDQRGAALPAMEIEPAILAALAEVNKAEQSSGIIPMDKLRRQLPGVPRGAVDAALMNMEQRGLISLKEAKSVRSSRAPDGIQSERGLLFFVVIP
jgi:hypothetical protein